MPKPLRLRLARDPAWARWVGNLAVREGTSGRIATERRRIGAAATADAEV